MFARVHTTAVDFTFIKLLQTMEWIVLTIVLLVKTMEINFVGLVLFNTYRSTRPEVFSEKVALKISQYSRENTCVV